MKISEFKKIVKEEIRWLIDERVGSKVLDPVKIRKRLENFFERKIPGVEAVDHIEIKRGTRNKETLEVHISDDIHNSTEEIESGLEKIFRSSGYYIGDSAKNFWNGKFIYELWPFETQEVDPPQIVWHITPKNKLLKIKNKGISPRESSKIMDVDDPRIYFLSDLEAENWVGMDRRDALASQMRDHIPDNPPFGKEMAYLKVDTSEINGKFYKDVEVSSGWSIYTRSYVPPSAIKNWEEYEEELQILRNRKKNGTET